MEFGLFGVMNGVLRFLFCSRPGCPMLARRLHPNVKCQSERPTPVFRLVLGTTAELRAVTVHVINVDRSAPLNVVRHNAECGADSLSLQGASRVTACDDRFDNPLIEPGRRGQLRDIHVQLRQPL